MKIYTETSALVYSVLFKFSVMLERIFAPILYRDFETLQISHMERLTYGLIDICKKSGTLQGGI